jgi:hypothetical protein
MAPGGVEPSRKSATSWVQGTPSIDAVTTELCLSPTTVPSDSTIAEGHTPPSMTAVGQGTVRRMTQFPVPLLRTNVKPARSKRVRVPL